MQLSKAADVLAVEEIKDKPKEFYQAFGIALNSLTAWEELKDGITAEKNRCLDMSGVKYYNLLIDRINAKIKAIGGE